MDVAIDGLAQSQGGALTHLQNIVSSLVDLQDVNSVTVFVSESMSELESPAEENLRIEVVDISNTLSRLLYEQFRLPLELYRRDVDVVFAPCEIAPIIAPCRVVLANQNPNIYYDRGSRTLSDSLRYFILRILLVISAVRAATVIFMSDTTKERACNRLPISKQKSVTIYHGVDTEVFRPEAIGSETCDLAPDGDFLLFVSTLYSHKNVESLLRAYSKVRPELREEYPLYIVGDDQANIQYAKQLKYLTNELDLENAVSFKGQVSFEALRAFYNSASLFVFPSALESFGFPVLEAMAAETPVLASSAAAIPEIVGDGGRYFDPHDPDQLAVLLEQMLESDASDQLIRRGKTRVREFTWEKCATETAAVLARE